jgi:hypothetical protein
MSQELVLTLSHLFLRIPCDKTRTSLPALPQRAYGILSQHNTQTLGIFRDYVRSYTAQHLAHSPDNTLPLTGYTISVSPPTTDSNNPLAPPYQPPVQIRSPFHALSGSTDTSFATVQELCDTVRAGVPLEASVVPGVPLSSASDNNKQTKLLNSYLLDFFKHGDAIALTRDNEIKQGDVWFRLKDFSLVLATIVTSLAGFMGLKEGDEMLDEDDGEDGDLEEEEEMLNGEGEMLAMDGDGQKHGKVDKMDAPKKKGKKKVVADSWEDEESSSSSSSSMSESETEESLVDAMSGLGTTESTSRESVPSWVRDTNGQSLVKVYGAFKMVKSEFGEKFRKMWA